jgi:hypothetical protein
MLNLPLYQSDNGEIDSARVFSGRHRDLGFRVGYARPPINHDFRAKGLHLIGMSFPLSYIAATRSASQLSKALQNYTSSTVSNSPTRRNEQTIAKLT